jgi:hypothetical protein
LFFFKDINSEHTPCFMVSHFVPFWSGRAFWIIHSFNKMRTNPKAKRAIQERSDPKGATLQKRSDQST